MDSITKKTKLFDELKHKEGTVTLWGHSCFISPIVGLLARDKLLEKIISKDDVNKTNYFAGKFQSFMGVKITGERFGYAKTYKNKKDLLEFSSGQFELLGYGNVEWARMDFKNELFIVRMKSPLSDTYRKTFGLNKSSVDFWNAGAWAGCLEYILGKKVVCIETSCIASGKRICEFVIKPENKWDKKDSVVKDNLFLFDDFDLKVSKIHL
jgi:predicted hydrocarbon binding protein